MTISSGEDVNAEVLSQAVCAWEPTEDCETDEIEEEREVMLELSETIESGDDDEDTDRIGGRMTGTPICGRYAEIPQSVADRTAAAFCTSDMAEVIADIDLAG